MAAVLFISCIMPDYISFVRDAIPISINRVLCSIDGQYSFCIRVRASIPESFLVAGSGGAVLFFLALDSKKIEFNFKIDDYHFWCVDFF